MVGLRRGGAKLRCRQPHNCNSANLGRALGGRRTAERTWFCNPMRWLAFACDAAMVVLSLVCGGVGKHRRALVICFPGRYWIAARNWWRSGLRRVVRFAGLAACMQNLVRMVVLWLVCGNTRMRCVMWWESCLLNLLRGGWFMVGLRGNAQIPWPGNLLQAICL